MRAEDLETVIARRLYVPSLKRVRELGKKLGHLFVQRSELIDLILWSSIAHVPLLLLGPWGTAKSLLIRQLSRGLGIRREDVSILDEDKVFKDLAAENGTAAGMDRLNRLLGPPRVRHFEYLVTRFTTPEELLGSVNIRMMLDDSIHMRQTRALMPRAEIVFLDEIFKANSAILNALLSIVNEKLFYNAGIPWRVNLVMLFGASNEFPSEEDLGAFVDRFPVRALCDPVDDERLPNLLEVSFANLYHQSFSGDEVNGNAPDGVPGVQMEPCACVNDFRLLRKVCFLRFGTYRKDAKSPSTDFDRVFLDAFRDLRRSFDVSDRSLSQFYLLARAKALLEREDVESTGASGCTLEAEDCEVLYYCGNTIEAARRLPSAVDSLIG